MRNTELDLRRLCEERAHLQRELQRLRVQPVDGPGGLEEPLGLLEKYQAYLKDRQK